MSISSDIDVGEVNQALIEQHLLIKLIFRSIVRGVNFLGTAEWGEVNEAIKVGAMWAEPYNIFPIYVQTTQDMLEATEEVTGLLCRQASSI